MEDNKFNNNKYQKNMKFQIIKKKLYIYKNKINNIFIKLSLLLFGFCDQLRQTFIKLLLTIKLSISEYTN